MSQTEEPAAAEPAAIYRARGTNASERILADLGNQVFLNLWSYPNLFYNKKQNNKGDGKELCDLLVVCGDDIIIFSDKAIKWSSDKVLKIAWPRFYRKAIQASVDQINGAERIITNFPEKIFTDPECAQPLPIALPSVGTRRVHGVVVATGCYKAIQTELADDSGSFMILPHLKGEQHLDFDIGGYLPFSVGDVNPAGMFVHVFDNVSIKRIFEQLDTIADFTRYLIRRADYLRSGKLLMAHGEEELLGRYLTVGMLTGEPNFEAGKRKKKFQKAVTTTIQGEWAAYIWSEGYLSKTLANDHSRIWDKLINLFSGNVIAGTSVAILGELPSAVKSERGLRYMALEDRFNRRILGEAVSGALEKALEVKQDRFTRMIMPTRASANTRLVYILMILAYPTELEKEGGLEGGYEQYRLARAHMLDAYCLSILAAHRNLNTAVAIAIDASSLQTGRRGGSEDLITVQIDEWTDELLAQAAAAQEKFDVFRKERLKRTDLRRREYPSLGTQPKK